VRGNVCPDTSGHALWRTLEMTPEQTFNSWLRQRFVEKDEDWMRVENTTQNGTPDINICKSGIEVWIEAKVMYPKGVLIRKEQFAWGVRRSECGGNVVVLAQDPEINQVQGWRVTKELICRPSGDGKTLVVVSSPDFFCNRTDPAIYRGLKRFLFPGLTI